MNTSPAELQDRSRRSSTGRIASASPVSALPPWTAFALAAFGWLAGCALVGALMAAAHGDHAAALFVLLGAVLGLAGALAHGTLLTLERFRSAGASSQAMLLWLATLALAFVIALAAGLDGHDASTGGVLLREAAAVVLIYFALPALAASFALARLVRRAAA